MLHVLAAVQIPLLLLLRLTGLEPVLVDAAETKEKLAEIGDGRTIAALGTEVAAIAADLLDSELARLQLKFERLTQEREEAAAEEQRFAAEMRRIKSGENLSWRKNPARQRSRR